jgi:signal transduction histidine kinase
MKRPSIRKRLIFWTTFMTALILVAGGYSLYSAIKEALYSHFDQLLDEGATVVMIEVEAKDSKVYHEWREALESNSLRRTETLIQVWDQKSGKSERSPALGENDLKKKFGELGERVFYDLKLPDGSRGRAVGVLIHPNVEHPEGNVGFVPEEHPQVFVWAQSSADLRTILDHTKRAFVLGGSIIIILLWSVIWFLTSRLLKPIQEMATEVLSRHGTELGQAIPLPARLPTEVAGMAEVFNDLLSKIDVSREKDRDFFLNVGHELRTPLAGVHFIIQQALRRPRENDDYRRRFALAKEGTEGLHKLVNRLMKMGRVSRSGEKLEIEPFEVRLVMETLWQGLSQKVGDRGLTMAWELAGEKIIKSDHELFKMVVANLFDNAASYAMEGSTVRTKTVNGPEGFTVMVENEIRDLRLSPDELSRLFDPFFRRDQAREMGEGHAGIGLGFCQEIMELLGGSIRVEQPCEGWISFVITLPFEPEEGV